MSVRLGVWPYGKPTSEYTHFRPTLFLLNIHHLPIHVTCNIDIYDDDTTFYSKGKQESDLWQQLELTLEFKFDSRDTVD